MSDFIYSSTPKLKGELSNYIREIYHVEEPLIYEYQGEWGSLAVSQNLYKGLDPYETEEYLCVVIGGPVLCFRDNLFLTGDNPIAGTKAIYDRWISGEIQFHKDLSGPFVLLFIDKLNNKVFCVTDLLMFIPVYQFAENENFFWGTHVDALAKASGISGQYDHVSLADFILNDTITFPYTAYIKIRQCHPAASTALTITEKGVFLNNPEVYWLPLEKDPYQKIEDAAQDLREGLQEFIQNVTDGMDEVAQFISAGEDSRAIAGLIPHELKRDAFIFLDRMNREGRIARKVAAAYHANFHPAFRNQTHYLDILDEASDMVGSGHQYIHAHSLGFHKSCNLTRYPAVFGGYLADSLLKASYCRKVRGLSRFPFLPEIGLSGETRSKKSKTMAIDQKTLLTIDERRMAHLTKIKSFRPVTCHEWFVLWPATMRKAMPNLYFNRRLFRSYEPMMCASTVKVSSAVPTHWKLNRRLFNKAFKSCLKQTRWVIHADGYLPYFPWWFNLPIRFFFWLFRSFFLQIGLIRGNQGPWEDRQFLLKSEAWQKLTKEAMEVKNDLGINVGVVLNGGKYSFKQKINLFQVLKRCNDYNRLGME